ncbi:triose-phosphate isomerase [Candidatus Saccharibacteria bacterium RIFCSPHIGHO2_12_FULL_41_12]|nr:MAG: triose-phosphate isomerase [Candidatus Saccharibacteria bacterium RIFCSPHIGHO2_12_FULL_41_12]
MSGKKTIIIGNWKMFNNIHQSSTLLARLHQNIDSHRDVEVVIAPGFLALQPLSLEIDGRRIKLAAQNAYFKDEGAFTGEVSFSQLRNLVDYVIIGHSERRIYFEESLDLIRDKVAACVRNGITPILCVGETAEERKYKETKTVLHDQVTTALANLTAEEVAEIVIAYEPVWAITTFGGEIAKPSVVKEELQFIRKQVGDLYGGSTAKKIRIIYGGSVDDNTIGGYLDIEGCDGAIPGSASLNYHKFSKIVQLANKKTIKRK